MLPKKLKLFLILVSLINSCVWGNLFAQFYEKSYALVIGINKYPNKANLTYARRDAQGIANFLKTRGFEVITLYDQAATKEAIISKMQNYFAHKVTKNDRVLFFFAGHGYTEELGGKDWGYILPYNAGSQSASFISMEELRSQSEKMGNAKHQLFIMDACYGGLLGTRNIGVPKTVPNYLQVVTKRIARQIITAGGKDQQVLDGGPGGHSVFTGHLLKALEEGTGDVNGDGYITCTELYSVVQSSASNDYQTPGLFQLPGHQAGEFVFRSPPRTPTPVDKITQPETEPVKSTAQLPASISDLIDLSARPKYTPVESFRFFGLGLFIGLSQLKADIMGSVFSPMISGHLRVLPSPFLTLSGQIGYSSLNTTNSSFKTTIIPFELSAIFNFLPLNTINPYIMTGLGGVSWKATVNSGVLEDNISLFWKAGLGLEYRLNDNFSLDLETTFRFSNTDNLDQLNQGDEPDQVLTMRAGLTYYFVKRTNDRDMDFVPDELDLFPTIAEDHDGYLDHDGKPENNEDPIVLAKTFSPVVVHKTIHWAEAGKSISVKAHIFSERNLKAVSALYRPFGSLKWEEIRMLNDGKNLFKAVIPGHKVTQKGLEYCIIALDETPDGVGYSGLPNLPIYVDIKPNGKKQRILFGVLGSVVIGTASYILLLRKQK